MDDLDARKHRLMQQFTALLAVYRAACEWASYTGAAQENALRDAVEQARKEMPE